jgi:hypothetical protein
MKMATFNYGDDKGDVYLNYGDDNGDVYLYLVMKMVTFNYGNVLVFVVMFCIFMESLALIGDALMMCIYLTSWSPCICILELSLRKMVMNW